MAKLIDGNLEVSEFKLKSRYYVHFRTNPLGKRHEPLYHLSYMLNTGFTLEKAKSRRYPAQTIMDADYADGQIQPPKLNPCCIAWRRQQVALASMSMRTNRSTGTLNKIKEEIYPLKLVTNSPSSEAASNQRKMMSIRD